MNEQLKEAIVNGDLYTVNSLMRNDEGIQDDYNYYAFRFAAENGHLAVVKFLVEQCADIITNYDYYMSLAAANGHLDVVKYLVQQGAKAAWQDNCAILSAAKNGHLAVVEYLASNGADVTAENNEAIVTAAGNGHLDVVKYLVSKGADVAAAIHTSAYNGHLAVIKYLVSKGADFTILDNLAICLAAGNGHLNVVEYLVEQGADFTVQNNYAIRWAAKNGHSDVVITIVDYFIDKQMWDKLEEAKQTPEVLDIIDRQRPNAFKNIVAVAKHLIARNSNDNINISKTGLPADLVELVFQYSNHKKPLSYENISGAVSAAQDAVSAANKLR